MDQGTNNNIIKIINNFTLYLTILHIKPYLLIEIVNNSPQVNEKDVLERMHTTAMLGCIGESLSLKSSSTHSLCLYLVVMLVRAKNLLSHRYVVEKGISVLTAQFAKAEYSV